MFNIMIEKGKTIKKIFQAVNKLLSESIIKFDSKGISLIGIDEGRIAMIKLFLSKEDFNNYSLEEESDIGLNLDDFVKTLNRMNENDTVRFSYNGKGKFKTTFKNPDENDKRHFSLNLIELGDNDVNWNNIDELKVGNSFDINCQILKQSQQDAIIYSETMKFNLSEFDESFNLSAVGIIGDYEHTEPSISNKEILDSVENTYSLEYLKNILEINSVAETVSIYLNNGKPMIIRAPLFENSFIEYVLAPRIEEDPED